MVSIFCMSVVFVLLATIYALIRITTAVIARITNRHMVNTKA